MAGRYAVEISEQAKRELAGLPRTVQERIDAKIQALADNPRPAGSKKLVGESDLYRIRAGDYRVVYRVRDDRLLVVVVRVGHRAEVYRRLRRMKS